MADITERIVIPEVPRVLDGQELYVYIPKAAIFDLNIEKGTGNVLVQTTDPAHSFKVMTDGRAKVRSAPTESDDVVRKSELDTKLDKGLIPSQYLPSYVDDVVEYDSKSDFPEPGETGKIYVDKSTNLTYRWSGSTYIQVGGGDLNLENGTGTGSLVQTNVVSSSGTPYTNRANGSAAIAFGKNCWSGGNTAFTIGQENKTGNYSGTRDSDSGKGGFTHGYNNINEGHYTEVGGSGNIVKGAGADTIVNGRNNHIIKSSHSAVFGDTNKVDGNYNPNNGANDNIVGGKNNNVGSSGNIVGGESNTANGNNNSLIIGSHNSINTNSSGDRIVGGHYNKHVANALMEIGNGTSDTDRKNAFEVLSDGRAKVYGAPQDTTDVVRKQELDTKLNSSEKSNFVDLTSSQNITGYKYFEGAEINNLLASGVLQIYNGLTAYNGSPVIYVPSIQNGTTYMALSPNTAPTANSIIVNSSTRTPTWKPVSEFVDLTSAQTITGSKTFSAGVIMQNGLWVLGSAAILGAGIQGLVGSPVINIPTSQSGITAMALSPNAAPTEPSFIVTAADRTPTWQSAAPILQDYVDDALLGG